MGDEVQVVDDPAASRFEVRVGGEVAGSAEYRRSDGTITFTHTVVDDAYEGRGLGSKLASSALDAARAAGESVVPQCSFIAGWIERHPAYADLVAGG